MTPGWYLSRAGDTCGSCETRIPAASAARRLATGRVRCEACARRLFNESPPAGLALVPASPPSTPATTARPLQPFVERFRQRLTRQGVDVKQRASGGDE